MTAVRRRCEAVIFDSFIAAVLVPAGSIAAGPVSVAFGIDAFAIRQANTVIAAVKPDSGSGIIAVGGVCGAWSGSRGR